MQDTRSSPGHRARGGVESSSRTILHVVTRYLRGGSERRVRDAVHALEEFDHVVVVGAESDLDVAIGDLPTATIIVEPSLRRSLNPFSDGLALLRLRRLIRRFAPEVVFTHQSKGGAVGRVAARSAGFSRVVHSLSMANFGPGYSRRQSALFQSIETRLEPWTSAYAVVGSDLADRYRQAGVPADKLRLIRSGVPIPRVDEDARAAKRRLGDEFGIPVDTPWLIHVGSLEPRKNVLMLPVLLQMLSEVSGEEPPHLVMAGVGPLETQLRNDFEAAGLSAHHTMLGFVNGVAPLIKASDVLLLLSSAEGLPQVLVQAASVDTPFVAFEVDGTREMVALGARGTLVELGDVRTAASAVADLLAKPPGPANIDLESWSPEEIRRGYRSLLNEVLADEAAVQFEADP